MLRERSCPENTYHKKRAQRRVANHLQADLGLGYLVVRANGVPVHYAPKRLEIIRSTILVLEIISVLPNVTAKNRRAAFHQRRVLIGRVANT